MNIMTVLTKNIPPQRIDYTDDQVINSWYHIEDVDELLTKILTYLNEEFNSYTASYWMSAANGFEEDKEIIALRAYVINEAIKKDYKNYIEKNQESDIENSLGGKIMANKLPGKSLDDIRFVTSEDVQVVWADIPTEQAIGIPIMRSDADKHDISQDKMWGVICLQPKKAINNQEDARNRLKKFAEHVQVLIEKAIYKRRISRIELLNELLNNLESQQSEQKYYQDIVDIVRISIGAEACSIFIKANEEDYLILKASTAKEVIGEDRNPLDKSAYIKEQRKVYELDPPDSITSSVYERREAALVFNMHKNRFANFSFMEKTKSKHKSLIALPLIDNDGNIFGVIRCINKEKKDELLHVFMKGDLTLLQLIVGIITGYLKNKTSNERSRQALTNFAHETRGPIAGLQVNLEILKHKIRNKYGGINESIAKTIDNLHAEIEIIRHNVQNTEYMHTEGGKEGSYNFTKCNVHAIIQKIAGTLSISFHKVEARTQKAPDLFVDEQRFHRLFYNLVHNAVRYSIKKKEIIITYKKEKSYDLHHFEIKNWGIGVEEDEIEKIFDVPNFRSQKAKETDPGGTGLGLKVCKKIVEKHEGKIKVTHLHNPTIISVYLPAYLQERSPKI